MLSPAKLKCKEKLRIRMQWDGKESWAEAITANQAVSAGTAVGEACRVTGNYKRADVVQISRWDSLLNPTSLLLPARLKRCRVRKAREEQLTGLIPC